MKSKKVLFAIFGLVLTLALAKIFFSNMLSTTGGKIAMLGKEASKLDLENSLLGEEIVKLSSLSRISSEAEKLGFGKPTKVLNLTSEIPVALK